MDPNDYVNANFPQAGEINAGADFMQSPGAWGNVLKAVGDMSTLNPNHNLQMPMPLKDPRKQMPNNYFPNTPTAAMADPAMSALFNAAPGQAQQPMTQLAGDVVPLPINPGPAMPGISQPAPGGAPSVVSDYNRLNGLLRALRAERSGQTLPSARVLLGPGAAR